MVGARLLTLALPLLVMGCECGAGGGVSGDDDDHGDGDADADGDGDSDTDADSDSDADADGDADPCAGTDELTVAVTVLGTNWARDEPAAMAGVDVALDCGGARREAVTDDAGTVVFPGLSLATAAVNVTAHHPETDAVTVLGVASGQAPLALALTRRPPFEIVQVEGILEGTRDGSTSLLSVPGGGAGSFDGGAYRLGFFPAGLTRLVAIEYLVDDADVAEPVAYFDATFPAPEEDGAGPDVQFAAAVFDAATIRVTSADPRLAERAHPSDAGGRSHWYRAEIGAAVHDVDLANGARNVLGFTTEVETVAGADVLHVSWNAAGLSGQVRTLVRVGAADLRVGAAATRDVAPDAIGALAVPTPPELDGVALEDTFVLGSADLEIVRPDWAVGPAVIHVGPAAGGEPLYGQDIPAWTVVVPETQPTFHLPAPPAARAYADVLGPAPQRVVVTVTNGVSPAEGVHWMAFDARVTATAP